MEAKDIKGSILLPITGCRVCGSSSLEELFSLGPQYVSDFVEPGKASQGHLVPITLLYCNNCTALQQKYTAPQDFMYTRHYWYRSGVTETMRRALADVTLGAMSMVGWPAEDDVILDIGSNDGTLLRCYPKCIRVGVEPATNLKEEGSNGIDCLINDFWSANAYYEGVREIDSHGMAPNTKIVTAIGMFYDLDDPNKFIADIARVLREDGVFVAQLMCLRDMLEIGDIGNLCHEHLLFYSLRSLDSLFSRNGLEIFDIERNNVNGRSTRLYARKKGSGWKVAPKDGRGLIRCLEAMSDETTLCNKESILGFNEEAKQKSHRTFAYIVEKLEEGAKIWVYGASTKGNTILQSYTLEKDFITAAADKSPEKHGKVTIGTDIPITSEEEFRKAKPDYALVLPYAFLPEFVDRESVWLAGGGKFIVPLPQPKLVGMSRNGQVYEEPI